MTKEEDTYFIEEFDAEEDDSWDAADWNFLVKHPDGEIFCICATREEAEHILELLKDKPFGS